MLGTPACPAARAELGKPLIQGCFSCKYRKDSRIRPQVMCSDCWMETGHSCLSFNYTASLFSSGLPCGRSIRLCFLPSADEAGQALCDFLPCFIFCPFLSFIYRWEFWREELKAWVPRPSSFRCGSPPFLLCGGAPALCLVLATTGSSFSHCNNSSVQSLGCEVAADLWLQL